MRVSSSSTLLLVLAFVLGRVNASSKSFLGQRQDETTVGTNPKYAITHQAAKAEEEVYWSRLMQETTMSVAPTPTPPSPTPETPTHRPPTNPAPLAPSPEAITQGPTSSPVEPPTEVAVAPMPAPAIPTPTVQPVQITPAPVESTPLPVIPTVQPVEPTPSPVEQTPLPVDLMPAPTPTASSPMESPEAIPPDTPPTVPLPTESPEEVPTEASTPPSGSLAPDSPLTLPPTSRPTFPSDSKSGQSCEDAISLLANGSITTGSNENGSQASFSSCDGGDVSGQSSWYSFVGTGRRMVVSTCTEVTELNTYMALYSSSEGQCNDLTCVAWKIRDGPACSLRNTASTIYFDSTEGAAYYIAIIGSGGSVGTFGVYVADAMSVCNDTPTPSLNVDGSVTTGTNENGPRTTFSDCEGGDVSGRSSWYSFVGTGRRMAVSTCTEVTELNTYMALYSSSEGQCNDLTCVAWKIRDGPACPLRNAASTIYFDSTEGTTYYVAIIGSGGSVGTFGLNVTDV